MTKETKSNRETEIDNIEKKIEEQPPGMPVWVKVSGLIAISVILLMLLIMIITGGEHGPGRHLPSGNSIGQIEQHDNEKSSH